MAASTMNPFECTACGVTMNGQEPYSQHMHSPKHFKRVNQTSVISVPDCPFNYITKMDTKMMPATIVKFQCSVCDVFTTGPEPYNQHMTSAKHLKKVAMANTTGNEIVDSTKVSSSFTDLDLNSSLEFTKFMKNILVVQDDQKIADVINIRIWLPN